MLYLERDIKSTHILNWIPNWVIILINDTGVGIPDKVFRIFLEGKTFIIR